MYTKAELFTLATTQQKPLFLNSVTLSVPDDADGCIDLDAEKVRLARIWDVANMTMRQMVTECGMTQTNFAKGCCIPLRTVQNWCREERECPVYLRFLLAEHYGLI